MLKQIAWNTFKTTGNINTMLELLEVDKTMDNMKTLGIQEKNNSNVMNNYIDFGKKGETENNKKWEL